MFRERAAVGFSKKRKNLCCYWYPQLGSYAQTNWQPGLESADFECSIGYLSAGLSSLLARLQAHWRVQVELDQHDDDEHALRG